jgi:glycosyltransferase involved in cell wall biosynthesis
MRVLIPLLQFGKSGGYRVLSQLANTWISMGHEVTFIVPVATIIPYFPTSAKLIWVDKDGNTCDGKMIINEFSYSLWQRWKALYKGMNKLQDDYDIILANHSLSTYPVVLSKIRGRKFYYIQAYEPEYYQAFKGVKNYLLSIISWFSYYLKLNRIVNADLYKGYKNIRTDKVVYPGIDFAVFKPCNTAVNNKIVLGSIGRLEAYKGTSYVLDGFLLAFKRNPNLELHVAFGDESLKDLHSAIKVFVPQNDEELSKFYNSLHAVIAAGTVQLGAIHYPVIEGMACNVPVITTGYYPATSTNSWIVPIRDANAIANQILNVIADPITRAEKVRKAHETVTEFSWDIVAQKMYNYFNSDL